MADLTKEEVAALESRPETPFLGNLGQKFVSGKVTFLRDFRLFGRTSRPCGGAGNPGPGTDPYSLNALLEALDAINPPSLENIEALPIILPPK